MGGMSFARKPDCILYPLLSDLLFPGAEATGFWSQDTVGRKLSSHRHCPVAFDWEFLRLSELGAGRGFSGYLFVPFPVPAVGLYYECVVGSAVGIVGMDQFDAPACDAVPRGCPLGYFVILLARGLYRIGRLPIGRNPLVETEKREMEVRYHGGSGMPLDLPPLPYRNANHLADEPHNLPATKYREPHRRHASRLGCLLRTSARRLWQ